MRRLLISLFLLLCSPAFAAKPNILFVLSDDHSYPFIHCYGRGEMKTPNLDRFAEEGIMCRRMFTSAPQCVPSRAAIMTGRSPVAARITRFSSPLPRDEITFPEILKKDGGYFVGCCGRTYHLDGSGKSPGADEVFNEHHLRTFKDRFDYVDASGQESVPARMNEFFDQRPKDKPYFLWVGFSDPHHPWNSGKNPPDPTKLAVPGFLPDLPGVRADLSAYEGEIEHCDADFQRVLDIVKERAGLENTLIIFMGDNGMAFPSGKGSLHDPGLNVPLLAWWPGVIKPGGDSSVLISGEDIAPTCLEAAGLSVPERISGVSFMPLLTGKPFANERKYIFAERGPHASATFDEHTTSNTVDYSRCVRSAQYKLIYNVTPNLRYTPVDSSGNASWKDITRAHDAQKLESGFETLWFTSPRAVFELYDLKEDPNELNNLHGRKGLEAATSELKSALQKKMILDFDYLPLPIGPKEAVAEKTNGNIKGDPSRAAVFKNLDSDHDDKLSKAEFSANRQSDDAEAWFKARDLNSDGFLDEPEYTASTVPHPPKR